MEPDIIRPVNYEIFMDGQKLEIDNLIFEEHNKIILFLQKIRRKIKWIFKKKTLSFTFKITEIKIMRYK